MINKTLRLELIRLWADDQDMRFSGTFDSAVDKKNIAVFKKLIGKHGWPLRSEVGSTAAKGAWIIAQHSDTDLPFQKKCLELLKKAVAKKEADPIDLAYLTDRVLVNSGKKQLYGTQFYMAPDKKWGPRPMDTVAIVEKRRAKLNMGSFKEYKKHMLRDFKMRKS